MIIQFSTSNYLSFKEQATLSTVASSLKESSLIDEEVIFPVDGTELRLMSSAAILGANASGKSNLIKALSFFKDFIINSFKGRQAGEPIPVESFRLNKVSAAEPSTFETSIIVDGFIYRYGFEANEKTVTTEWLYKKACKKRAKEVELYYREADRTSVHPKYNQALEIVNKRMVRDNALLLSTLAQFNDPTAVSIINWLNDTQVIFCSDEDKAWKNAVRHLDDNKMRQRIVEFSKYADLGINNIEKVNDHLVSSHVAYDDEGNPTGNVSFSFEEHESEGTLKYFSLAYPILDALDHGHRVIIDEFDSKLHPLLTEHIIALFNSLETNPHHAQLIFTTHDTNLLSSGMFRRDQVWFTQKNRFGATELYSLSDYKVRSNSPFERDYLSGKYGAVPVIGNINHVMNIHYGSED